jgi:ADP-heptose:LPS heptosyltransferase
MSRRLDQSNARYPLHKKEIPIHSDRLQKVLFDGTSRLTDHFPRAGARFLDLIFRPVVGSPLLFTLFTHHNQRVVRSLKAFRRFLVISDIHIGDAVMAQASISAVRDLFPDAHVDYVINKAARPLIEGNPEVTRVLPFFTGGFFPSAASLAELRALIKAESYDLCLNFSPFIKDKDIVADGHGILNIMTYAPVIMGNEKDSARINHFIYHEYWFTRDLLSIVTQPVRKEDFRGVRLTLSDSAIEQARRFSSDVDLSSGMPIILYNPDAASCFTRMPFEKQADLLARLARLEALILLGAGHTDAGIGERLKARLPVHLRSRVKIIPSDMPLEVFSALIDFSDVFISGDTGPLHLAAARRYSRSGRFVFRNRTAVLSFFGATPSRMSGYDSFQAGYLPANQDAPSWAYTAGSPCRNITCLNKMYKTCRTVRCFEEVDVQGLSRRVSSYLEGQACPPAVRKEQGKV